jgi:hypothetical protein
VSHRTQDLARRRQELIDRSSVQRAALAAEAAPLVHKAAALDRVITSVRHHPVVTGLAAAAVVLLGARQVFALGSRALTLYALFRQLRG